MKKYSLFFLNRMFNIPVFSHVVFIHVIFNLYLSIPLSMLLSMTVPFTEFEFFQVHILQESITSDAKTLFFCASL